MTAKQFGQRFGVLTVMAMVFSSLTLPASGTPARGVASISAGQRNPVAGITSAPFDITVTNTPSSSAPNPGTPTPLNFVDIRPPEEFFTIIQGVAPAGWTTRTTPLGRVIFEASSATNAIPPGGSAVFRVIADVGRPAVDTTGDWGVGVSDNAGQTVVAQSPSAAGALSTVIRVLSLLSLQLAQPAEAAAGGAVTEAQNNTVVELRAVNAGSGNLPVTATLTQESGSSSFSPDPATSGPKSLGSGAEGVFNFPITIGNTGQLLGGTGTLQFTADAAAPGADASPIDSGVLRVDTRALIDYDDNSVQPEDVSPGSSISFQLNVAKTGHVAVSLNKPGTQFCLGTRCAGLASPDTIGSGSQTAMFVFNAMTIPSISNPLGFEEFTPVLKIAGTDSNGAVVTDQENLTDIVTIDARIPEVLPELIPPASRVPDEPDATTDGATLEFGGTITDRGEACDDCSIRSAFLRQYQGAPGAESAIPGADIPVTVENDGGDLTGSYDGPYSPLATSVQLFVAAADLSLLEATGVSAFTPVDNVDPNLVIGRTGDVAGQDRSTIRVFLSERVAVNAAMSPSDWRVADHQVAAAQLNEAAHNGRVGDIAFLTVVPQLGRNEEPQVTYTGAADPERAFDRVGQTVADKAVNTIDGILPALPSVQRVAGMGQQAGKFYTNDSTPTFELSSATAGDKACIYRDNNGNGAVDPGTDTLISKETADATIAGCPVAEGSNLAVETRGLPTSDAELGVLVQFTDARNNIGPNSSNALVLDYTAPAIAEVAVAGTNVTVTFSEFVARGRNFASDWVIFATRPGGTFKPFVGQVTGSGTTRTLTISDERYDAAVNNVTAVAYEYQGALTDRYEDRATNKLDNATFVR